MSIRTEPKEMSPGMAQALTLPQHVMTAAQAEGPLMAPAGAETAMVSAPVNDQHLAGANDFNTSNPHHPYNYNSYYAYNRNYTNPHE